MRIRNIGHTMVNIAGYSLRPNFVENIDREQYDNWMAVSGSNRQVAATQLKIEPEYEPEMDPPAGSAPPAPTPEPSPVRDSDRMLALVDAVSHIDDDDRTLWTSEGKPTLGAIRAASSLPDVTAAERDLAWQDYALAHK